MTGVGGTDDLDLVVELGYGFSERVVKLFLDKASAEIDQLSREVEELRADIVLEFFELSALSLSVVVVLDLEPYVERDPKHGHHLACSGKAARDLFRLPRLELYVERLADVEHRLLDVASRVARELDTGSLGIDGVLDEKIAHSLHKAAGVDEQVADILGQSADACFEPCFELH